ncbi:MAG: hypothetical protein OEW75_18700 [Cyclobacteriaceae bacterium]|nr:hypothetical protein [Cyclobacteriaceae bacterium]
MVKINENSLTIEFVHPAPNEALKDLQKAIIQVVQVQADAPVELMEKEKMEGSIVLLELLKQTLNLEE